MAIRIRLRLRAVWGSLLAAIGVGVLLVELVRYWRYEHPIHPAPIVIGCIIGFVGFYLLDPKGAEDGGGFLVTSAVRIIGVVRGGRRSTDAPVVIAAPDPAVIPTATPVTPEE